MPDAAELTHTTAVPKRRRPCAVGLLCVATLGVYACVWYYKANREMRDFGSARGDQRLAGSKPARSVLAITVGGLLVLPPFISLVRTMGRVHDVECLAAGTARPRFALLALMLSSQLLGDTAFVRGAGIAFGVAGTVGMALAFGVVQARLNGVWGDERA